jgi:hypothetical protein
MKGVIIGSDLMEKNGSVEFLEINTNTTIYNEGADMLEYEAFFSVLTTNSINELHFIYTEGDSHLPLTESFKFEDILKQKCTENSIAYFPYVVPKNSVTVPYIEDSATKFILRQSFDTTALVDETYCANKFEFCKLMEGSSYTPKTYFLASDLSMDTLDTLNYTNGDEPNLVIKSNSPSYNSMIYPELYSLQNDEELNGLKTNLNSADNNLLQEFIYDSANIIDGRYSVIRSIDIIYGPELEVINMGGYRQSAIIPLSFATNEFVTDTRKFNQKTRYKYITKGIGNFKRVDYHVDDDTQILQYDGTLKDVNTIQLNDKIKTITFTDLNGTSPSHDRNLEVFGWDNTLEHSNSTLQQVESNLVAIASAEVETIYIRITLANGLTWTDAPSCTYYIEEAGITSTRFEKVNNLLVGDKLVTTDHTTSSLTTVEITGLEMEFASKTIYGLDFEPDDLFLVDIGDGLLGVMHNGCWCPWSYCGNWCYGSWCPGCYYGGGFTKYH